MSKVNDIVSKTQKQVKIFTNILQPFIKKMIILR